MEKLNVSTKQYFEYRDDKSAKFWLITINGVSVLINFGKIGTVGQTQEKTFDDVVTARKYAGKQISEKTKKGYLPKVGYVSDNDLRGDSEIVLTKDSHNSNTFPAEFEALRALFSVIRGLLADEPTESRSRILAREEFIADYESGFKSGSWSWTPNTSEVEDDHVDRCGEVIMGPMFSSEEYPWPEDDGVPMAPLLQLDLGIASKIGGINLGDGLIQVWMPKYVFEKPVVIRVIPRQDITPLKLTPTVDIPKDLDSLQFRDEQWSDELETFVPDPAIQISGYASRRFTWQIRHPIQSNYSIDTLTLKEEISSRIKEFDKRIKPLLKSGSKGFNPANCHLFGTFAPIQYNAEDKPVPLFCFESDEFGLMWGDGGNAQLFYSLDAEGNATFSFDWSCT